MDDDESVRNSLGSLIRSMGLEVETFTSAQQFLAGPRADVPSRLVLDMRMPGLSGLDLQQLMAEVGIGIPIIFIAGHGDVPTSVRAMKAGAVEFLTKPFRNEVLLDAIQKAVERDRTASQAATLVIRALALGEVTLRDWWRIMRREISAGLALGSILGSIGFMRITAWSLFSNLYGSHWLLVAITVGVALIGIVLWRTLAGSMLPLVLRRFGFDPATSSAPFVATLVDVTGLVIYFTAAMIVLRGSLL